MKTGETVESARSMKNSTLGRETGACQVTKGERGRLG